MSPLQKRVNLKPAPDACTERERLSRRAERHDRYTQVMALRAQGFGNAEIARRVGLTTRTLQNWQKKGSFPEVGRRRKRPRCFDPYASYVLSRWEQGCQNGSQLYREIKAHGYTGQERQVHRFLLPLRKNVRIIQKAQSAHIPLQDFSAHDAVWLFVHDLADLDMKEQTTLTTICQASETARTTYVLWLANGIATTTPLSLEEYVRALWSLLPRYETGTVTFSLLGQLLHDAFFTEPLPFEEHWLQLNRPPDVDDEENKEPFAALQQMIGYQIADLHRMAQEKLLDNKFRYFGITSPTGYTWYNFDPSSYLHCAIQSLQKDNTDTDGNCIELTILLWLGQIYE